MIQNVSATAIYTTSDAGQHWMFRSTLRSPDTTVAFLDSNHWCIMGIIFAGLDVLLMIAARGIVSL